MFEIQEMNLFLTALNELDIKGKDAAYIATVQIKIGEEIEKKQKQLSELPPLPPPSPSKKNVKKQ
jgi:hypothetical protein